MIVAALINLYSFIFEGGVNSHAIKVAPLKTKTHIGVLYDNVGTAGLDVGVTINNKLTFKATTVFNDEYKEIFIGYKFKYLNFRFDILSDAFNRDIKEYSKSYIYVGFDVPLYEDKYSELYVSTGYSDIVNNDNKSFINKSKIRGGYIGANSKIHFDTKKFHRNKYFYSTGLKVKYDMTFGEKSFMSHIIRASLFYKFNKNNEIEFHNTYIKDSNGSDDVFGITYSLYFYKSLIGTVVSMFKNKNHEY